MRILSIRTAKRAAMMIATIPDRLIIADPLSKLFTFLHLIKKTVTETGIPVLRMGRRKTGSVAVSRI